MATGKPSFRVYDRFLNDQAGNFLTQNSGSKIDFLYVHALLNAVVSECLIRVKNTTQNITADSLDSIPIVLGTPEEINEIENRQQRLENDYCQEKKKDKPQTKRKYLSNICLIKH